MLQFDDSRCVDAKQYHLASFSTRNSTLNTSLRKPIRMQDFIQLCDSNTNTNTNTNTNNNDNDKCKGQGWFEITIMITPWIIQHKVQLLTNRILKQILELKMSFGKFFCARTSVLMLGCQNASPTALFINVENCAKHCQKSPELVRILW